MKKLLLVAVLLTQIAHAADFAALEESGSVLNGALRGIMTPAFSNVEYIAGYGLHFSSAGFDFSAGASETVSSKIQELLPTLADTVSGLNEGEWVSASYVADTHVIVRVKPNQPDTLEVWVDGEKR